MRPASDFSLELRRDASATLFSACSWVSRGTTSLISTTSEGKVADASRF